LDLLQLTSRTNAAHVFNHYKSQFGREYEAEEHSLREQIFHKRLAEIQAHNTQHRTWRAGVNHLTDRTDTELLQMRGYRRHGKRTLTLLQGKPVSSSLAENKACVASSQQCHSMTGGGSCCNGLVCGAKGVCEEAKDLPAEIDWSSKLGVGHQIVNQGACGSCWAIAAQGAIESQASLLSNASLSLSAQGMLGCTPNPHECGGTGGCDGATPELAFEWAKDNGIATISEAPYTAETECPKHSSSAVVKIQGFMRLPENKPKAVLQSLVAAGPLVVAVDASRWSSYMSGVFDNCHKNPVVDHAVLLMGYGKDDVLGVSYWKIRNSWSKQFGEDGFIRLRRHAPDGEEPCGWDYDPQKGVGCKGGPKKLWVCGECGVLSDTVYPVGTEVVL
jgi:cathepsin L